VDLREGVDEREEKGKEKGRELREGKVCFGGTNAPDCVLSNVSCTPISFVFLHTYKVAQKRK